MQLQLKHPNEGLYWQAQEELHQLIYTRLCVRMHVYLNRNQAGSPAWESS